MSTPLSSISASASASLPAAATSRSVATDGTIGSGADSVEVSGRIVRPDLAQVSQASARAANKGAAKKGAAKKGAAKKGAAKKGAAKKGAAKEGAAKKGAAKKGAAKKGAAKKGTAKKGAAVGRKRAVRPTPPGTDPLTKPVMRTKPFALRQSPIAGRGAFATRDVPKEARIAEYFGRRITPEQADEFYPYPDDTTEPHHTFLYNLDEHTVLDGAVDGDSSRFINHSCEPNCEAVIEDSRIFIETLRDIAKGEELLYDYQFVLDEPHTAAAKKRYPCYCGTKSCRGTILAKKR